MNKFHRSAFLKDLKETFPAIRDPVNQQYGLLHLEMSEFCHFTQAAIDGGNRDDVISCFQIAEKYVRYGNSSLVNAFAVSYLEHLNFNDGKVPRSWAKRLLPTAVRELYDGVMDYQKKLGEKDIT